MNLFEFSVFLIMIRSIYGDRNSLNETDETISNNYETTTEIDEETLTKFYEDNLFDLSENLTETDQVDDLENSTSILNYKRFFNLKELYTKNSFEKTDSNEKEFRQVKKCLLNNKACLIICEQSRSGIHIYDLDTPKKPIWSMIFDKSFQIPNSKKIYYRAISDAKFVYKDYIAVCTSGGAVAIIEIRRKLIVRQFILTGNLHSIALTPDGTIFAVASTENYLAVLSAADPVDLRKDAIDSEISKWELDFGHALVYDKERNKLWAGGNHTIQTFMYNFDPQRPKIAPFEKFFVEDDQVHDMFPIPETDFLWVSTLHYVYAFNVQTGKIYQLSEIDDVKSLSTLPEFWRGRMMKTNRTRREKFEEFVDNIDPHLVQDVYKQGGIKKRNFTPTKARTKRSIDLNIMSIYSRTIYIIPEHPETEWWTQNIKLLSTEKPILTIPNARIYKTRWLCTNTFSENIYKPIKYV